MAMQIDPLSQAMLNGYDQILEKDPKDYVTLFQRAAQYFNLSEYDKSFNDIVKALQNTPSKDKEMHVRELSLLADVSIELKDYNRALEATERVLSINPSDYANTYKKGNILLYLDRPEEAYKTFSSLQRLKSRSQEAYFGMAQANIKMGKTSEVESLLTEAANADPSNYITYCRVGDLYKEMGENERAATNYIVGHSLSNGDDRALESLVKLASKDFNAVNSALDYSISKTTSPAPLLLMKSVLSNRSGRYAEARASLMKLLENRDARQGGVYRLMALTDMALDNQGEALENINKAILENPTVENYTTKGEILYRQNKPAAALIELDKALQTAPGYEEAQMISAKCRIALDQPEKSKELLSEVIMTNPENIEALLLRGYLFENKLGDSKSAVNDYIRAGNVEGTDMPVLAYRAIAKAKSGKKIDADAIISTLSADKLSAEDYYYIAMYYAQTGDLEKGIENLNKSLSLGYQNKYNIVSNKDGYTNISTIRYLQGK